MPGILQEKFQVDNPQQKNDDASSGWVTDRSARTKKGTPPGREGRPGGDPQSQHIDNAVFWNGLPPGTNIEDQEATDQRQFKTTMGGESDVSADFNATAVRQGYKRKPMRATDDEYSNAHVDAFYDEIKVGEDVGFTERNNVLDRM